MQKRILGPILAVKGDMSIVGPRPERIEIIEDIIKVVPEYRIREQVKSGITGLSHIEGDYYTNPKQRLEYDLTYMSEWSIKNDIKIVFRTFGKIIKDARKKEEI